ncbi:MAG: metal-dependent transcriptional regulator, partial [Actinomycetota bacterium]|nr:metal-dependent transcriptional regulator [Actinomycetota bacterium]
MRKPTYTGASDSGRAVEDYVKAIFFIGRDSEDGQVSVGALAARLGVTPGSASAMVKRLAGQGLVVHEPYRGVSLT